MGGAKSRSDKRRCRPGRFNSGNSGNSVNNREKLTASEFLASFDGVKETAPGQYTARCPAHDDETPSLSIKIDGSVALLHCHSGCRPEDIVKEVELTMADLYLAPSDGREPSKEDGSLSLKELAADKGLPVSFLVDMDVVQKDSHVVIHHYLEDGSLAPRHRIRTALVATKGSEWSGKKSDTIVPYGLDDLGRAEEAGYQVLVEGESDCLTLWYHDFPALGVPGADMVKIVQAEYLEGIDRLYVIHEPDDGGDRFIKNVTERLRVLDFRGEVYEVNLVGNKDPNDLHKRNPRRFKAAFQEALDSATPIDPYAWPELDGTGDEKVLPFPVDIFPSRLAGFVNQVSRAMSCPADFVGASMLTVAGAAIGNSRRVLLKQGWTESPSFYGGSAAPPGTTKSPAIRKVVAPIVRAQARLMEEWERGMAAYQAAVAEWEAKKGKKRGAKPTPPILKRVLCSDSTVEALAVILSENPRGVLLYRDELTGWVRSMNQYRGGKGPDRQFFLSAWSGEAVTVDRKNNPVPVMIQSPFLCILGTILPDMFNELLEDRSRSDGCLERMLVSYPAPHPAAKWTDEGISNKTVNAWETAIDKLLSLKMDPHDRPRLVSLTDKAKRLFTSWYNEHVVESQDPGLLPSLQSAWSKMRGHCARLMLVVQQLRKACGEVRFEKIDGSSVRHAIRLVDYFKSHLLRVHRTIAGRLGGLSSDAGAIVAWVRRHGLGEFSSRDLWRHLNKRFGSQATMENAVKELEGPGLIRRVPVGVKGKGRSPSPTYEVHPGLFPEG